MTTDILCTIGLDVGTGSVKALALTQTGQVLGSAQIIYTAQSPQPGYMQLDANELCGQVHRCMVQLLSQLPADAQVEAIGLSTAMHSIVGVNHQGKAITPLLTWADARSNAIYELWRKQRKTNALHKTIGVPPHPMLPLFKIAWFKQQQPELCKQIAGFVCLKAFLWYQFTQAFVVDYSNAAAYGMFDASTNRWSADALAIAGITAAQLPAPQPTTHFTTHFSAPWRLHHSILPGCKLVLGSSDGCCANIGSGVVHAQALTLTIGTSAAVRLSVAERPTALSPSVFCYPVLPRLWVLGGGSNHGGNAIQWFVTQLLNQPAGQVGALLAEALALPPEADGVVCLPYLLGERAPVWNPAATGMFAQLQWHHNHLHLLRAMVEAVSLNLLLIAQQLPPASVSKLSLSGGFTQNPAWVQLVADVFGLPASLQVAGDASARGAALLAWHAATNLPLHELSGTQGAAQVLPNLSMYPVYQHKARQMQQLYQTNYPNSTA